MPEILEKWFKFRINQEKNYSKQFFQAEEKA